MIHSFASRLYKGLTVCYSYIAENARGHYTSFADFNGATPALLEITIEDIKVGDQSILEYISGLVLEGLEEEIAGELSL